MAYKSIAPAYVNKTPVAPAYMQQTPAADNNNGSPYGGGGGGYGGGGGGGSSPTDKEKKAAGNLKALTMDNMGDLLDKYDDANRMNDIADQQNRNNTISALNARGAASGNEWYLQYQALANTLSSNRDAMGNSLYGSGLHSLNQLYSTALDRINAKNKNALRTQNEDTLQDYAEKQASINNSRNKLALDTDSELDDLYNQYVADLNNINPDLAEDLIDTENNKIKVGEGFESLLPGREKRPGDVEEPSPLNQGPYALGDWNKDNTFFENNVRDPLAIRQFVGSFNKPGDVAKAAKVNNGNAQASSAANVDYWRRLANGYEFRN